MLCSCGRGPVENGKSRAGKIYTTCRLCARENFKKMIQDSVNKRQESLSCFEKIFSDAIKKGNEAAEIVQPVPMVVQQHANVMDDNSPVVKQWECNDGVCGFGWVEVSPGNSSFANWLKSKGYFYSNYGGCVHISSRLQTQSLEKNAAWAAGLAKHLNDNIHLLQTGKSKLRISSHSRID